MGLGTSRTTALVTGAAGFIGSHLVDRLLREGFEVVGVDNLMTGDLANLRDAGKDPHFHFQLGDVRDPMHVYAELIFNLACPASPIHYQSDPYATTTSSVLGAMRLMEMARGRRCVIVHASTSEVYGDPTSHPQTEAYWGNVDPIGERACYDEGKRCAETLLMDGRRRWGLDARIARIFNTYGPRMALDDGRVVSNFIVQALRGRAFTIRGDGSQTRSFCYVDDIVDGIVAMSRAPSVDGPVNLGNPSEITIADLAREIAALVGAGVTFSDAALAPGDPRRRRPDITLARELLGFAPEVDLRAGLGRTLEDFRRRLGAARVDTTDPPG